MKKTLTIIASALCLSLAQAQHGYRSFFGQESTEWYIAAYECGPSTSDDYLVTIGADTTIGGLAYKQAYAAYRHKHDSGVDESQPIGHFREDTLTGRLWFREASQELETLLADLSMEVGGNYEWGYTVDSVYTDTAGRKVIRLKERNNVMYFIEGLGRVGGFFHSEFLHVGLEQQMVCIYHDGAKVYNIGDTTMYDEVTCKGVIFEGIEPADFAEGTIVYPNPFREYLKVEPAGWCELSIFDTTGILRHQAPFPADGTVDVSQLEKGMYMLLLKNGKSVISKKIIKL